MADSDVKMRFFASAEAAERAIVGLEQKYAGLENKIKQVGRQSRKSAEEGQGAFHALGGAVTSHLAGLVSIGAAIGVVTAAWGKWRQEIEQAADEQRKFSASLLETLVLSGDLAQAEQIKTFLQALPVKEETARQLFDAVRGASPSAPLERIRAITAETAKLGPLLSPQNLARTGAVSAELAEALPGRAVGDISDLTVALQAALGADFEKAFVPGFERAFSRLTAQGATAEQALGVIAAGAQSGLDARSLETIANKLNPERGVTLDKLLADPALAQRVLGREQAGKLSLIDPQLARQISQDLVAAQAQDLAARIVEQGRAAEPLQFREFEAARNLEAQRRAQAEQERAFDVSVQELKARTQDPGLQAAIGFAETVGPGINQSLLTPTGQINLVLNAILQELRGQKPRVNRQAHVEGAR